MADIEVPASAISNDALPAVSTPPVPKEKKPAFTGPRPPSKQQILNKLYALPAPLRTFPLPTLVPHNPLSLFHLIYVWVSQTLKPGNAHLDPVYQGWFSPETRSVHVTDPRSIRGLWEQGFYGKGSLSRSEPSWLSRETTKQGTQGRTTAEERTRQRRAERQQTKWERARKEREAIDQKLLEEAETVSPPLVEEPSVEEVAQVEILEEQTVTPEVIPEQTSPSLGWKFLSPVGPLELLALPNSMADFEALVKCSKYVSSKKDLTQIPIQRVYAAPVGPLELLALPNRLPILPPTPSTEDHHPQTSSLANGHAIHSIPFHVEQTPKDKPLSGLGLKKLLVTDDAETVGGSETNEDTMAEGSTHSEDTDETASTTPPRSAMANCNTSAPRINRQKSVRFSPTIEKATFIVTDPPRSHPDEPNTSAPITSSALAAPPVTATTTPPIIKQQEHTQLTLEEAFFLSYGLGALQILDTKTHLPIPQSSLFTLFRQTSHFPPALTGTSSLSPDDPFLLNYVVYHHYRSLGWVPRSGIKFSVDLMLYIRGPVFTHAEYGVLILPSYSDPYWRGTQELREYVKGKEQRTWHWVSCINRVITQVKKTLVLTYVDVPPPVKEEEEVERSVDEVLGRYKVREVVLKRWVANRSRD